MIIYMVKVKKWGKVYWKKRLFQFIIEKATNYTYMGLSSHSNMLGVENKIAKILIMESSAQKELSKFCS